MAQLPETRPELRGFARRKEVCHAFVLNFKALPEAEQKVQKEQVLLKTRGETKSLIGRVQKQDLG
eukprot:2942605-Lingulodinium_polyedra.AAC.1